MGHNRQSARQWQLLRILEDCGNGIDIDELAEQVRFDRRTIERDLAFLKDMGFPLLYKKGENGKKLWLLQGKFANPEGFEMNLTEMISLHLARQFMSSLSVTPFGKALDDFLGRVKKLLSAKTLNYFSRLDESFYVKQQFAGGSQSDKEDVLKIIQKAISQNKVLDLFYRPGKQREGYRTDFHPYGLVVYEGSFYLVGFSVRASELRTYKLQRIQTAQITQQNFSRPEDFSPERCFSRSFGIIHDEIASITVRCRFSGWAVDIIKEQKWHRTQTIEKDRGNSIEVSFLLNSTTEFKRWILGFGPLATVLEPESLRNEIAESLKKSLQNYLK